MRSPRSPDPRIRPPRQARSRATLDRFFRATAELLAEKRFEDATVAELSRRAHSSVGAFYTRFEDKRTLIEGFEERLFAEGRARWDALLDPRHWRGERVAEILQAVVERLVETRRRHSGLLRSLALYARSSPAPRFRGRAARLNRHVARKLHVLVLASRDPPNHPDPPRALDIGLLMVDAAVREAILFSDAGLNPRPLPDRTLTLELTRAWCRYLGVREPRRVAAKVRGRAKARRL